MPTIHLMLNHAQVHEVSNCPNCESSNVIGLSHVETGCAPQYAVFCNSCEYRTTFEATQDGALKRWSNGK